VIRVAVEGDGPAACSAILVFRRNGTPITLRLSDAAPSAFGLVLDESAVSLLLEICGDPSLFDGAHQLRRRIVCWGTGAPRAVDQAAVSISSATLRERLINIVLRRLDSNCNIEPLPAELEAMQNAQEEEEEWRVSTASRRECHGSVFQRYGGRVTLSTEVALADFADRTACWIEARPEGWIFLAPLSDGRALLHVTVPAAPVQPADDLAAIVGRSRHIRRFAGPVDSPIQVLPSAPGLRRPCGGVGWLAAGAAGMALDPLCGDGTAQAFRAGMLAAAVIGAAIESGNSGPLVRHFIDRLEMTFAAHLDACAKFYDHALFDASWSAEIAAISSAAADFARHSVDRLQFRFQDLQLTPLPVRSRQEHAHDRSIDNL